MMEIVNQPKLGFLGVDILKVEFNASGQRDKKANIKINCIPKVFYPEDKCSFHIVMEVSLCVENHFELDIVGVGNFEVNTEITPDIKKKFVNANAPAIMFPYIRSFITTFTANLGNVTGSLVIPPQFFHGEIEEFVSED